MAAASASKPLSITEVHNIITTSRAATSPFAPLAARTSNASTPTAILEYSSATLVVSAFEHLAAYPATQTESSARATVSASVYPASTFLSFWAPPQTRPISPPRRVSSSSLRFTPPRRRCRSFRPIPRLRSPSLTRLYRSAKMIIFNIFKILQ